MRTEPIDQPFRPKADFFVAWALLAALVILLTRGTEKEQGWFSYGAFLILLSLFATIILYGPVILVRQVLSSGTRGWFVAQVFISTLLGALLFAALLYFTGHGEHPAWYCGIASSTATAYLHWRLRDKPRA